MARLACLTLPDLTGSHTFTYDALSRLTRADHPGASQLVDETFTYDAVGNRVSSHLSSAYVHDAANRLLEDDTFTYTYDANGNRTSTTDKQTGAVTTYHYDVENQLIQLELPSGQTARYRYDGLGRRIEKDVAGTITRYVYDQEDILATYTGTNCWQSGFFHGPGIDHPFGLIRDDSGDCTVTDAVGFREPLRSLQTDGLGSLTSLVSETSGFFRALFLAERYTYDAFGSPRITGPGPDGTMDTADDVVLPQSAFGNPFLFTGREFDPESSLYYYRRRYYDPVTGRFLQEDDVRLGQLLSPDSFNLYMYVSSNPIRLVDPLGELIRLDPRWAIARQKARSELRARFSEKFSEGEIERASTIFADELQPTDIPKLTSGDPKQAEETLDKIYQDARDEAVKKGRTNDVDLLDRLVEEGQRLKGQVCP